MKRITIQNKLYYDNDGNIVDECWLLNVDGKLQDAYTTKQEAEKAVYVYDKLYNEGNKNENS